MTRAHNPGPPSRSFAPASRSAHPGFAAPASRGSRLGRTGSPGARAVVSGPPEPGVRGFVPGTPIPTSGIPGPKSRDSGRAHAKVRKPKTESPTRSLRVSGSTRTIPLGPSGPGRAALPLDMTVSWAGAAGAASRSRSTSGSRMAARSSERSAGDGCLDPFARYRFLTGRRGVVRVVATRILVARAPSRIRTRHAHAVPDPARQMMAQT